MNNIIQPVTDLLSLRLIAAAGPITDTHLRSVTLTGRVHVRLFDENMALKDERRINNLVVDAGKAYIASTLKAAGAVAATLTVTAATNASPIVVTTSTNHGMQTGQNVFIYNVAGNTATNGLWVITKVTNTTFSLVGSTGNGAYTSGGSAIPSVAEMAWMAVGTGSTAPAAGDTDLQAEISTGLTTRVSATRTNPSAPVVQYSATWAPGQATNGAITEAGTFNSFTLGPAQGTMLDRATFTGISKGAGDTLNIVWQVTVS